MAHTWAIMIEKEKNPENINTPPESIKSFYLCDSKEEALCQANNLWKQQTGNIKQFLVGEWDSVTKGSWTSHFLVTIAKNYLSENNLVEIALINSTPTL